MSDTRKAKLSRLEQIELLPPEELLFGASRNDAKASKKRNRKSKLETPILNFIDYFHVVTTYQVLYQFFAFRGKSPVYGWRILRKMQDNDLITSFPIYPELGAASLNAIRLTAEGYRKLGKIPSPRDLRTLPKHELEYQLQFAEMMLQRGFEGWRLARPEVAFEAMRRWALAEYRTRLLNETERLARERIERMPAEPINVPMLVHPQKNWIRFVLPARPDRSFKKVLESLPSFALLPRIPIELVCADSELLEQCRDMIDRHAKENRYRYTVRVVPHFSQRPNPRTVVINPSDAEREVTL